MIEDRARGDFEIVEGVGTLLMQKVQLDPKDAVVLISNSGRNPLGIEIADYAKKNGNKIIVVTALEVSKNSTSLHSSGKLLYEFADVVLDNKSEFGDAALPIEGLDTNVCGTSSISSVLLLQQAIYEAVNNIIEAGVVPPVYKSANVDGGREYNDEIEQKYADRIWHI